MRKENCKFKVKIVKKGGFFEAVDRVSTKEERWGGDFPGATEITRRNYQDEPRAKREDYFINHEDELNGARE